MAMKKYTRGEGTFEVLQGAEAMALHEYRQKIGKSSVTDFTPQELAGLDEVLKLAKDAEVSSEEV
jgi:hypothetical protein